mgnify:CR=1 FL=1
MLSDNPLGFRLDHELGKIFHLDIMFVEELSSYIFLHVFVLENLIRMPNHFKEYRDEDSLKIFDVLIYIFTSIKAIYFLLLLIFRN